MKQHIDATIGAGSAAAGSLGLTVQAITDGLSLMAAGLNVLLAFGGLLLLWHRYRVIQAKRERLEK